MDDTLKNDTVDICTALEDRKGKDVLALKLGAACSWADYLIIATASSSIHLNGLAEAARTALAERGIEVSGGGKNQGGSWRMIDGGNIVVSLMNSENRAFYALEELWFESQVVYKAQGRESEVFQNQPKPGIVML